MNKEQLIALALATNLEVYDHEWEGGQWMYSAVETRETIDEFVEASHQWQECTSPKFGEIAGMPFVAWTKVQARKGDVRDCLSVIDFGDLRIAVRADLTLYL